MTQQVHKTDEDFMRQALALGRFGLGMTAPNPAVGCVLVKDGQLIGCGVTQKSGRPHAEAMALAEAGDAAQGATAYVTLEPCAHTGQTPPCAASLKEAGVARVVYAIDDPDPRVNGGGAAMLREAGISVESGLLADEARRDQLGFLLSKTENRPMVTLKLALSANALCARHRAKRLGLPARWPDRQAIYCGRRMMLLSPAAAQWRKMTRRWIAACPDWLMPRPCRW